VSSQSLCAYLAISASGRFIHVPFVYFCPSILSLGGQILVVLNEDEAGWSVCCFMPFQGRDRMPTVADNKVRPEFV
jgi:hypothetical protein